MSSLLSVLDDLKILLNDWPYGLEKDIVHLVVWTKFDLDENPATGMLTDDMWKKINDYVEAKFRSRVAADQVSLSVFFSRCLNC
jgi:Protein of unknown function (DUF3605)